MLHKVSQYREWLSDEKYVLLLLRTQVQFPEALSGSSQLPVSLAQVSPVTVTPTLSPGLPYRYNILHTHTHNWKVDSRGEMV